MIQIPRVELVTVGDEYIPAAVMADLARGLTELLGTSVNMRAGSDGKPSNEQSGGEGAGEPMRLSSDELLDELMERDDAASPAADVWTVAVTGNDLYAEGRSFVFGEATVGGRWALVSVARFGVPARPSPRLAERLLKEALHEIGHLASAGHCGDPACLMAIAKSVADVDTKKLEFCEECRNRIFQHGPLVPRPGTR